MLNLFSVDCSVPEPDWTLYLYGRPDTTAIPENANFFWGIRSSLNIHAQLLPPVNSSAALQQWNVQALHSLGMRMLHYVSTAWWATLPHVALTCPGSHPLLGSTAQYLTIRYVFRWSGV
jgi:hypothetical protein